MKDVPNVLLKLNELNKGRKVKLRAKQSGSDKPYQLYLDYSHPGGKRVKKYLKLSIIGRKDTAITDKNTMKIALLARDKADLEAQQNITGIMSPNNSTDFLHLFREYSEKKSDDTNYRISYDHFSRFLGKNKLDIRNVDIKLCEGYRDYLLSLDIIPYTALHYFVTFKATLNQAVKHGHLLTNPAKGISIKYEKKSINRLSVEEVKVLMNTDCAYPELKNGFLFACFTGLRFSDLTNLKYSDIKNNRLKIIMLKTRKEIEMKLHLNAEAILKEQKKIRHDGNVFKIPTGGKTSNRLKKWFKDAGIDKDLTFHCSRHTFGCMLIESGVDVFSVMKLMGHNEVKTTLQYVEKVGATKDKAIDKMAVFGDD
jgi:integrase